MFRGGTGFNLGYAPEIGGGLLNMYAQSFCWAVMISFFCLPAYLRRVGSERVVRRTFCQKGCQQASRFAQCFRLRYCSWGACAQRVRRCGVGSATQCQGWGEGAPAGRAIELDRAVLHALLLLQRHVQLRVRALRAEHPVLDELQPTKTVSVHISNTDCAERLGGCPLPLLSSPRAHTHIRCVSKVCVRTCVTIGFRSSCFKCPLM